MDVNAANVTFDGGPSGTGTDIGTAANWSGDVLPSAATPDIAIFDGTVAGNLVLSYGGNLSGSAGNAGIQLNLASTQTSPVTIDSGSVTASIRIGGTLSGINQTAVLINSGAGAFTLGDGNGTFNVTLGGSPATAQFFTNNSTSMATISSDVVFGNGGGGTHYFVFNGTGNWTVNSKITNSSNVTIFGSGTVFMNGANSTYAGGTFIGSSASASILRAGATQALGTGGITFDTIGNATTPRLELAGGISLNNAIAFTARTTDNTSVAIESISGNNTLSGLMTLGTGGQAYRIQSDADTLALTNTGTSTVTSGKTVYFQGAGNGSYAGVLAGAGSLLKSGTGTWTITGTNTYTGTTTINAGTLQLGDGTTDGTIAATSGVINTGTVAYNWTTDHTASYVISGAGALTKSGAGTLTLGGTNTYTGTTTINAGAIAVNGSSLADTTSLIINGGKINVTGTEVVNALYFGSTLQASGTWGASGSGATHINDTYFTGTGVLSVTTGAVTSAYDAWATSKGLTSANNGASQDPDADGISNSLEFVLGGDPLASDTGKLPALTTDASNFIFTFSRADESESEITLVFQYSSDLTNWTNVSIGATSSGYVTVAENGTSPDTITVTIPKSLATNGKLFGRLSATK